MHILANAHTLKHTVAALLLQGPLPGCRLLENLPELQRFIWCPAANIDTGDVEQIQPPCELNCNHHNIPADSAAIR